MSKFTPGPWSAKKPEEKGLLIWSDSWGYLAHVYSGEPDEANANLIAAAPTGYAASQSTAKRLYDLPRFLRENNECVLAEVVEEELAKHRAYLEAANG